MHRDNAQANVEAQAQIFTKYVHTKEAKAIAELHTTTVYLLPPGNKILHGHANIREYYQTLFDNGMTDMYFETIDACFLGEQAIREIGHTHTAFSTPDGIVQNTKTTYVAHWKIENGEYKIDTFIWNS